MNVIKERIYLKPLCDFRKKKSKDDLLFTGMEENPKPLPTEFIEEQKKFFNEVVKPTVERVWNRQIE